MRFNRLNLQTFPDLLPQLYAMLDSKMLSWHGNQISLTTIPGRISDTKLGTGSLTYDWDNKIEIEDEHGNKVFKVPEYQTPLREEDFSVLCSQFSRTVFEDVHEYLKSYYKIGRLRIMQLNPKNCLTWHTDTTPRIHYPMKTQEGCFMVIEDQSMHLNQDSWWLTNTVLPHTAFNGSKESRIHLVGALL
jgi:hypothetical protein